MVENIRNENISGRKEALKQAVLRTPGVISAGFTDYSPIDIHERLRPFQVEGAEAGQSIMISTQSVDYEFLETYKVPLTAGRFYSRDYSTDGVPAANGEGSAGSVVINSQSVKTLGFSTPEEALGKYLLTVIGADEDGPIFGRMAIIGVTPDIYFQSPKKAIRAEIYLLDPNRYNVLAVKYNGDPRAIVDRLEGVWDSFTNDVPFQYGFVDDAIAEEFRKERDMSILLATFSFITIVVACLGLYGLAAFTAERRTKEIGIRKVLGAGVFDIVRLLVWQFSKPVLLANLIAWPLAIWAMTRWLESFPYRIDSWLLLPFLPGRRAAFPHHRLEHGRGARRQGRAQQTDQGAEGRMRATAPTCAGVWLLDDTRESSRPRSGRWPIHWTRHVLSVRHGSFPFGAPYEAEDVRELAATQPNPADS
ncbi:FtsX-like permease family protein [Sphingosinicella soli]|uniref:ABC3 transporter permease C-terminal domain-containing protein n=1 Tax=Sphingosinicella soli TaxID=333708 RepID=A0A7W7B356_9SPHN|nr:FtsX-like permease family protein [Sphingosinicella soli]MBB4633162.1 hypothetical protein [Sphingosinicella soli]